MSTTDDLPELEALREAAREAATHAYVPYSGFRVGAAVLCGDGSVVVGCNVENASYGLSNCAERTAVFAAIAAGHRDLVAIAVSCIDGDVAEPATLMPCGACRQVLVEHLPRHAPVAIDGVGTTTIDALLPQAFRLG